MATLDLTDDGLSFTYSYEVIADGGWRVRGAFWLKGSIVGQRLCVEADSQADAVEWIQKYVTAIADAGVFK